MATKIRLKRGGKKKQPTYRIVIMDSRSKRDGQSIEIIGQYNPRHKEEKIKLDQEKAKYWLGVGAQPTDTVQRLFAELGLLEKKTRICKNPGVSKKSLKEAQEQK